MLILFAWGSWLCWCDAIFACGLCYYATVFSWCYDDVEYLLIACMVVLGLLCGLGLFCGLVLVIGAVGAILVLFCAQVDVFVVVGLGWCWFGLAYLEFALCWCLCVTLCFCNLVILL